MVVLVRGRPSRINPLSFLVPDLLFFFRCKLVREVFFFDKGNILIAR